MKSLGRGGGSCPEAAFSISLFFCLQYFEEFLAILVWGSWFYLTRPLLIGGSLGCFQSFTITTILAINGACGLFFTCKSV